MPLWISVGLFLSAMLAFLGLEGVSLLGPWSRLKPDIRKWYGYRRPLMLVTVGFMMIHLILVWRFQFHGSVPNLVQAISPYFGIVACFFLLLFLLSTLHGWRAWVSWKSWSVIHATILATFLCTSAYVQFEWSKHGGAPAWSTYALIGLLFFWTAIAPWAISPTSRVLRGGWRTLSILLYPSYLSFWLYLFFGPFAGFEALRLGLILALFIVCGSVIMEWVHGFREKRQSVSLESLAPWYDAIAYTRLSSRGSRIQVAGISIACFLVRGKPIAFFGYCSREPNPLWLGFIHEDELYCPWHGCRFSVRDGSPTRGLQDAVPRFETKIVEDRVWVKVPRELTT